MCYCARVFEQSELFPTEVRALAHGISAAAGKFGALIAGLVFSLMTTQETFLMSGLCSVAGIVVTALFVADVSTLDLTELDKQWECVKQGNGHAYVGEAVYRKNMSMWEWCRIPKDHSTAAQLVRPTGTDSAAVGV